MTYISAKEVAELWGITPTRVIIMAKKGQIKGARLIGKSWAFPSDVEKPLDRRYKKNKDIKKDDFRFPLFCLKAQDITILSPIERDYYECELLFFELKFDQAYEGFSRILRTTSNTPIKAGCLYYLIRLSGMMGMYQEALTYYEKLKELLSADIPHKNELLLLFLSITTYVVNNAIIDSNLVDFTESFDSSAPFLTLMHSYRALLIYVRFGKLSNMNEYLIPNKILNAKEYPLANVYSNIHIGLLYSIHKNPKMKQKHIRMAFLTAIKAKLYYPLVVYYNYVLDVLPSFENEIPKDVLETIRQQNIIYVNDLRKIKEFSSCKSIPELDIEDYEYLGYLLVDKTYDDIAEQKGITPNQVYYKYKELRERLGAKNKKDLIEKYKRFLFTRSFDDES